MASLTCAIRSSIALIRSCCVAASDSVVRIAPASTIEIGHRASSVTSVLASNGA
jgi:hypothetical protein